MVNTMVNLPDFEKDEAMLHIFLETGVRGNEMVQKGTGMRHFGD